MKKEIIIKRDGKPFIQADKESVVFGYGENSFECSWKEIEEILRLDYENYMSYHTKEKQ